MISTDLSMCACQGHVVVTLRGELDLLDAPYVTAALAALADREPAIVVNLTWLEFLDCGGVQALVSGRRQARGAGGDLVLAVPQRQVMRLLASTGWTVDGIVYATVNEAVASRAKTRGA